MHARSGLNAATNHDAVNKVQSDSGGECSVIFASSQ